MSLLSKLFNKGKQLSFKGVTDWHCHILPGVDDGVETMDEALAILGMYEHGGIRKVWLTPHIMEDVPNTTEKLRRRFEQLKAAYTGNIELHLAAENMMDNIFAERLEADDLLPIGDRGDMLLVETSYYSAPMRLFETIEKIKSKGYFPLLAHPERYNYIEDFKTYKRLRDAGVRFQINLMSLGGHYGPVVRDKALRLLAEGYVEHFGTDLHHAGHLDVLADIKVSEQNLQLITPILRAD